MACVDLVDGAALVLSDDGLVTIPQGAASPWGSLLLGDLLLNRLDEGVAAHRTS